MIFSIPNYTVFPIASHQGSDSSGTQYLSLPSLRLLVHIDVSLKTQLHQPLYILFICEFHTLIYNKVEIELKEGEQRNRGEG
jgi:hypothetical protein